MNERIVSVSSRRRRGASRGWAVLLLLTTAGAARGQDFAPIPPTLLIPNYDRVYPGLIEALEGGAFVARARSAPALFYNPAGIALAERTVLNASAQGYQLTTLSGSGFQQSSGGRSRPCPASWAWSSGRKSSTGRRVRIGFAVVHPVHSNLTAVASTVPADGAAGLVLGPLELRHPDSHVLGGVGGGAQLPPRRLDRVSLHQPLQHRGAVG